jgi:hypothetical protein
MVKVLDLFTIWLKEKYERKKNQFDLVESHWSQFFTFPCTISWPNLVFDPFDGIREETKLNN